MHDAIEVTVSVEEGELALMDQDDPNELVLFGSDGTSHHMTLSLAAGDWVALGRPRELTVLATPTRTRLHSV